jgi:hypothetical protein
MKDRPLFGRNVTRWSTLRAFGNAPLAKATIAVPVLGYLLITNGDFSGWFDPPAVLKHAQDPPVPLIYTHMWRLVFIYYGLTFTAIATAWFGLSCPKFIKKFGDSPDYAAGYLDLHKDEVRWTALANMIANLGDEDPRLRHADANLRQEVTARKAEIARSYALTETEGHEARSVPGTDGPIVATLRTNYAVFDLAKPFSRACIALLYVLGLVLVLCSSLWGIAEVTASLFGWPFPVSPWAAG